MTSDQGTGLAGLRPDIERRGLRDHAYDRILELLMRGDVQPGARLSIDSIARRLDVSPTPVREAMVMLERTGLVTREALKGYRVAPPLDADQLGELFTARLMLETTAARLATPPDQGMVAELRTAQEGHRAVGERVTAALHTGTTEVSLIAHYFAADAAFHRVIFQHCHNRYLTEMSDALAAQLHRMRQTAPRGVTDVSEAVAEHAAIVDAFVSGDARAPEQAMRAHIESVRARSLRASLGRDAD